MVAALGGRQGTRGSGSTARVRRGKTTLAARIAAALPGSVVVHVDDFARPDRQGWERDRFVRQVLQPVLAGRPGRLSALGLSTATWARSGTPSRSGAGGSRGVSATDVRLGVPWDFTIWVEVPYEIRLARVIERDGPERDGPLADRLDAERETRTSRRSDLRSRVDLVVSAARRRMMPVEAREWSFDRLAPWRRSRSKARSSSSTATR